MDGTRGGGPDIGDTAIASLMVGFYAVVYIFFGFFLLIAWIIWNRGQREQFRQLYGEPEAEKTPQAIPIKPTRMFGAPAQSQWLSSYEYWLYRIEQVTGKETTTTPAAIYFWCLFISLAPAVVIGIPSSLLLPQMDGLPLWGLLGFALVAGLVTAHTLTKPAQGWFGVGGKSSSSAVDADDDAIRLGEDVHRYW